MTALEPGSGRPGTSRAAFGPSAATTTARLATCSPPASATPSAPTASTRAPKRTTPSSSRSASWRGIASMPSRGSAASPWANMRNTNSNMRLDVSRSRSRNIPPRNGRMNRSMIRSEKPKARSAASVVVSGRASRCSIVPFPTRLRSRSMRSLSAMLPTGALSVASRSPGLLRGSATR